MNRDRLLADAKARALAMVPGYQAPTPPTFRLPGVGGKAAVTLAVEGFQAQDKATAYDGVVAGHLADVLTGGEADLVDAVNEGDLMALERKAFLALVRNPGTQARIEQMLTTGKPLRN
jgi:3-hydroxyacyl-CoA dehydrogenase